MTSTLYSALPQPKYSYTTTKTHTHLAPQSDHLVSSHTHSHYKQYQSYHPYSNQIICILAQTQTIQQVEIARLNARIPPYGRRDGYIPREPEDYGDGGAFPEIHIKQYPLDMGRKNTTKSASSVVPLKVNEKGEVQYDAILRENMRKEQIMHSKYEDLIPKEHADDELSKPSKDEEIEETEETRKALEKLINAQIESVRPTHTRLKQAEPVTVRYQAASANTSYASGSKQRLIKIYEMPVDPLDPPKFKHKKLPPRPPSPPVPIMHSPPRQVTVEDQKNWKIPPCVSNWKNNKGFTLPLHQRLAADGRGLYNHVINDKFAKFSEALLIAERQARKEVEARAQMRMKLSKKQKQQKEKELAMMAKKAKEAAKFNYYGSNKDKDQDESDDDHDTERRERRDVDDYDADKARRYQEKKRKRDKRRSRRDDSSDTDSDSSSDSESSSSDSDSDDDERRRAFEEREKIRKERERERKRQYRLDKKKTGKNMSVRQRERDISEKIALGQFSGKKSTESLYDNRLFNQDSGLQAGFGADDNYNLYDKPLFQSKSRKMYRPSQLDDEIYGMDGGDILNEKSDKIRPHKGFDGAEDNRSGGRRNKAGFEFEKDSDSSDSDGDIEVERRDKGDGDKDKDRDELGDELDRFTTVKERAKEKGHNKGYMFAAGGGSARNKEEFEAMESNRDNVGFEKARKDADGVNNQDLQPGLYYTEEAKKEKERRDREREEERERSRDRDRDYDRRRDRRSHRRYDDDRRRDRRSHHDYRHRDRDRDRDRDRYHHSDRRRRYDDRERERDRSRERDIDRRRGRDKDRRRDRSRDRESSSSGSDRGRWGH